MNPDYEKQLEAEIGRALRSLPELRAPDTLAQRVMSIVNCRATAPWYRQPWQLWPANLRYAALTFLLVCFGGLCFASWELTRAAGTQLAWEEVSRLFSGVNALYGASVAVMNGLVLALRQVNPIILCASLFAVALAWAVFVGLGTACVKLALARANHQNL